ncbi:MAG: proline dehydrogenase family protein [Rhodothermales bacterium]|nr:proline dehydrogenase family protein [Rhodothermales bacterium]
MKLPYVLARRFVAGETLADALPTLEDLHRDGLFTALDLLGEDVQDRRQAEAYTATYIGLVETLAATRGDADSNVSIKLSMIGQRIDHDLAVANLRRLLDSAKAHDTFVRLDMEGSDLTQSTLDIFEAVYPDYPDHVGVVLQAYLHRTDADVDRMCELNARVRLCKGAYKEPPEIAYQDMSKIRTQFVGQMERLIGHARYPGIATHDDQLIQATKQFVAGNAISHDAFEFQMLYGIRPETQREIVREGYHMRVYVPYGTEWVPYFTRRLRERKENVTFVLKNLFRR